MNSQPQTNSQNSSWEIFAELQLGLIDGQHQTIHDWLNLTLEPLKLHEDICHRVEISLQEATTRALNTHLGRQTQHVHLKIYRQSELSSKGNNWSFFQVEKIQDQSNDGRVPNHAIELFLYLERH